VNTVDKIGFLVGFWMYLVRKTNWEIEFLAKKDKQFLLFSTRLFLNFNPFYALVLRYGGLKMQ
jgi:hypothetical protein